MSHLALETLARLVDEAPAPAERLHLEACPECTAELNALIAQRDALRAMPDLAPPPDGWPRLRVALREEGLVKPGRAWAPTAWRAAAAIVLFLGGGAVGYAVRGPVDAASPATPGGAQSFATSDSPAVYTADQAPTDADALFMNALDGYMSRTTATPGDPAARLAALENIVLTTAEALNEAPADPVISGYHRAALAQRNAVLRQLAGSEPIF